MTIISAVTRTVLIIFISVLLLTIAPERATGQSYRPNFVLILTDDQETASFTREIMPYTFARLVDKGVTFDNSFVSQALCCPNRATLLTGKYPRNHSIQYNGLPDGGHAKFVSSGEEANSLAVWLQAAGYRTGYFGKYMSHYAKVAPEHVPPGWDEWHVSYTPIYYFDFSLSHNGVSGNYAGYHHDDIVQDLALKFLMDQQPGQPFLLVISTWTPHATHGGLPAGVPPRHRNEFLDAIAPRPPSFNEADVSDKGTWISNKPLLTLRRIEAIDELWRSRLQSLQVVDRLVRRVVLYLYRAELIKDTYVIYTSDNGFHMGQHRVRGKNTLYEEDIRVPLVVRGVPGTLRGGQVNEMVTSADLAPTILDLAGLDLPTDIDGRSFAALLRGQSIPWRSYFMVENWGDDRRERFPDQAYIGVRGNGWLYARYADGFEELYDMKADPWQLENIAGIVAPPLLADLSARLEALLACAGASCQFAEDN